MTFISELRDQTAPFFQRENQELESYKAEKTGKNSDLLQPWEVGYWSEKLKKERYDFDEEDLRPYFPYPLSTSRYVCVGNQGFWSSNRGAVDPL
jgi:oligopeptidase A